MDCPRCKDPLIDDEIGRFIVPVTFEIVVCRDCLLDWYNTFADLMEEHRIRLGCEEYNLKARPGEEVIKERIRDVWRTEYTIITKTLLWLEKMDE